MFSFRFVYFHWMYFCFVKNYNNNYNRFEHLSNKILDYCFDTHDWFEIYLVIASTFYEFTHIPLDWFGLVLLYLLAKFNFGHSSWNYDGFARISIASILHYTAPVIICRTSLSKFLKYSEKMYNFKIILKRIFSMSLWIQFVVFFFFFNKSREQFKWYQFHLWHLRWFQRFAGHIKWIANSVCIQ